MKVYELMARLEKLPSGADIICSGEKTLDDLEENKPIDNCGCFDKEYSISENIIDVVLEGNYACLKF